MLPVIILRYSSAQLILVFVLPAGQLYMSGHLPDDVEAFAQLGGGCTVLCSWSPGLWGHGWLTFLPAWCGSVISLGVMVRQTPLGLQTLPVCPRIPCPGSRWLGRLLESLPGAMACGNRVVALWGGVPAVGDWSRYRRSLCWQRCRCWHCSQAQAGFPVPGFPATGLGGAGPGPEVRLPAGRCRRRLLPGSLPRRSAPAR